MGQGEGGEKSFQHINLKYVGRDGWAGRTIMGRMRAGVDKPEVEKWGGVQGWGVRRGEEEGALRPGDLGLHTHSSDLS